MDTSETYIKMCEKAEEIQKSGKDIEGINNYYDEHGTGLIWLPRQDQLQEMIETDNYSHLLQKFIYFTDEFYSEKRNKEGFSPVLPPGYNFPNGIFTSMEQLWLAFCMSEKFNKIWDGNNWIKE